MKKQLFLTALLVATSLLSFAQDNSSYKTALKKMMQVSGTEASFKGIITQMVTMFKQQQTNVPGEFWDELTSETDKMAIDQLIDLLTPIYQKHLAESDLNAMIAFYETPSGKKFAEKSPLITQESMVSGQEWGKKIGEKVINRLKEKGYLN